MKIYKSRLEGELKIIPSKSYAHRLLIAAFLSKDEVTISNVYFSKDVEVTLKCLKELGANYVVNKGRVTFLKPNKEASSKVVLDCFESGSTIRFLLPLSLALVDEVTLIGSPRLFSRGLGIYEEILNSQNIFYELGETYIKIKGKLHSGEFAVRGDISSQYITGLLFTLPLLKGDSSIKITTKLESSSYVDITLDVISKAGIEVIRKDNIFYIKGDQEYNLPSLEVEGDYSSSAFFEAFNHFNSNINISNLNKESLQGDRAYLKFFDELEKENAIISIANSIDLGPVLFVFAALKNGATFVDIARLRIKESDRVSSILEELSKIGVKYQESKDEVVIYKSKLHRPTSVFNSHNDHRILFALTLVSTLFDIEFDNIDAKNKSYPTYFEDFKMLGGKIDE